LKSEGFQGAANGAVHRHRPRELGWHPASGSLWSKRFSGDASLVLTSREEELSWFILLIPKIKLIKILDNCSFNELSFGVDTRNQLRHWQDKRLTYEAENEHEPTIP
jgi:hypothetical protein